jgi:hypothetical protein
MKDTSPEMETRYRAMLLARSGEERLRMAGSMYATARALVVASVRHANPTASPAEIRQAIFLRFYGHEFDEPTRARILARLGPPARRVAIDWDILELALTWRDDEHESYLDLRTGEIRQHGRVALGGETDDDELSEESVEEGLATGDLIHIEAIESSVEYRWMEEFAASVGDGRLRDRLEDTLRGRRPFRRFKDVLGEHRVARERWLRFHDARVREATREWLAEHAIEPMNSPPERGWSDENT